MTTDNIDPGNLDESPKRLFLGGYVAMTEMGFCVPCFGVSRLPNQWYVAVCDPPGDPDGKITEFAPTEITGVKVLHDAAMRSIGIGERWVDVFVWNGRPHIGTRTELWAQLEPELDAIADRAPLSALDLSFGAKEAVRRRLSQAGARYLRQRFGETHARNWQRQIARTRFLTRLRQAGIDHEPERFRIAGKGSKAKLSIHQQNWSNLADDVRDTMLRAAEATSRELDLGMELVSSFKSEVEPRLTRHLADITPFFRPPEQPRPRHDAASLSILLLTQGRRAERIARAAKTPEWTPTWSESGGFHSDIIGKDHSAALSWLPWIEVCSVTDRPTASGYGAVVALADDVRSSSASLGDFLRYARSLAGENGVVILAPALPEEAPPRLLSEPLADLGFGADIVLDTSLARSPTWGVSERLSLDRRITDLILTTAEACLPGSRTHTAILAHQGMAGISRIASLAIWRPDGFTDAYDGTGALISECNRPYTPKAWIDDQILLRSGRGMSPAARLVVGDLSPDFEEYAESVLASLANQDRGRSSERPYFKRAPMPLPSELRKSLKYPAAVAGFALGGSRKGGLVLVAETPTIQTLELAHRKELVVARVTDASGIRRLSQREAKKGRIPTEIALPKLHRFAANRRLATRGLDPRDVVRVPMASDLGKAVLEHALMSKNARTYLPGPDSYPDELAIPIEYLERLAQSDGLAAELLTRFRGNAPTGRRLADLASLWNPPAIGRYLIQDGSLPPRALEFDGHSEAPSQTCFVIDGDEAVPLLFGSSLFGVWGRITRSRGTGWAKRFSLARTFETFPILAPFFAGMIPVHGPGAPISLTVESVSLRRMATLLRSRNIEDASYRRTNHQYLDARAEADEALLKIYGLPVGATELSIASQLLELNRAGGEDEVLV